MKHFGYWVFGADMNKINLETLHKNGVTDLFLNFYAFEAHGESKVVAWIKKANAQKMNVHIWVQCFYNGNWINPKTDNLSSKLKEIKKYANVTGVKGIHLDYLRYPGNAYKTSGGADAITAFVKKVRSQNPNVFLSCAVMPEEDDKKYYGQDIPALGKIVDCIIPMQYKGNYQSGSNWLKSTTKFFSGKAKIWSGLQTYKSDDDPTKLSASELLTDSKTCLSNGAKGIVLFRYGICPDINFTSLQDKTTVALSTGNIKSIATSIKNYIDKNKKLPSSVTINKVKYTWPQLWYIVAYEVNNIGKSLASVPNVKTSTKASGESIHEMISQSDFKDQAKRIVQYIKQNGKAPNYVTSVKSKKKIRPKVSIDGLARVIVHYYNHNKVLPNNILFSTKRFKSSTPKTTDCTGPRYISSPHFLTQGAGQLGQITPSTCGPHSCRQSLKKLGVVVSESTLASWAGTVEGSGTDHDGINTAIAMAAKKAGVKIDVEWVNFSSLGSNDAARFKALGELICQKNVAAFLHILYSGAGDYYDPDDECGHYEPLDRVNIETKYVRALNSLGSRDGYGYYGHLQDRTFNLEAQYISGISQKSVCILRKK